MLIKKKQYMKTLNTVLMAILVLVCVMPVIIMMMTAIKPLNEIYTDQISLLPVNPTLQPFADVLSVGDWGRYFLNTIFVVAVNVGVSLFINSLAGYAFARIDFRGKKTLFLIAMIAMMLPSQVTMLPLFMMLKNFPFVGGNNWLGAGGTGFYNTLIGVCLPALAGSYGVFLCRQYFTSFPQSLDDAAEVDGCSKWRAYFLIYLPLAKPILATLGTLKLTGAWNDYVWPLVMLQSKRNWTVQLALAVYKGQAMIDWNLLMAATLIVSTPLIICFLAGQKYFVKSIVLSGNK